MRGHATLEELGVATPERVIAPGLRWIGALSPARVVVGAALVGLGFLPLAYGSFGTFIAAYAAIFAILGLSIVVVTGYAGLISLMPFSFVGIGTFATGLATAQWGWPFWLAVPFAALATLPVSVLVGAAAVRLKGLYLAIATLAFANALGETLFDWEAFTGGQAGHTVARPTLGPLDFSGDLPFYLLSIGAALVLVWAVHGLKNSRSGRAMLAVRDNEREAMALGVNVYKTKLLAFVISGMIAGIGGGLYAALLFNAAPAGFRSPQVEISSLLLLGWVVIGGIDTAIGAFLGGIALVVQQQVFQGAERLFAFVGAYQAVLVMFFLLYRPGGLVQVSRIQAALIREKPRVYLPVTILLVVVNVGLVYVVLRYGSEG